MKKSLLISLDFAPKVGGVAQYLKNLCAGFPADRLAVLVPSAAPIDLKETQASDQKRSYRIYRDKFYWKFWPHWLPLVYKIWKCARKEKVELLQIGQVLPVGTAVYILNALLIKKYSYWVYTHGMDIALPQKFFIKRILIKKILTGAERVIANSHFTEAKLIDFGVNPEKITVIHPGVKVFDVHQDTRILEAEAVKKYDLVGKRILLTLGRLVERKGHDTVLQAVGQLVARFPNLVYVIVGSGQYLGALKVLTAKLKLEANVIFTGQVSDKQKIIWLDLCEIFVMTPRQLENNDVEGFGIVYLEAGGLGKPVIASASGGIEDAVVNGLNGLVVPPDDVVSTAAAITRLLEDQVQARALGEAGRRRAMADFTWSVQSQKLTSLLA